MRTFETPRTIAQALEDAASSARTGYRFVDEATDAEPFFTYASVERSTARMGGALQALGLRRGDRVALILPDNTDFVFCFLGAIRAGFIPVPIYPPTGLGKLSGYLENTLHIVSKSGAQALVTSAEIKRLLGTLQAQAPDLRQVIAVEGLRDVHEELKPIKIELDDTCFLQFTSGSTSRPKGVVLTHANLSANIRWIVELGLHMQHADESGVSWLPLYHDMGLIGFVITPLYTASTVTLLPPLMFLKRPARWLEKISRHRSHISFGPNFAYALCVKRIKEQEMAGLDLSTWRVAGCGAEPIRAENLRAFADKFAPVGFDERAFVCCYGMAESTLAVSFSAPGSNPGSDSGVQTDVIKGNALWSEGKAMPVEPGSEGAVSLVRCGTAFPDHEIAVFAPEDAESARPLGNREVGELRLRGPSVMSGYFNDAELTAQAFAGGWLMTGDLGYLADGHVHICGRMKEVIIVNGRNYYPQDIEWEASRVAGVRKGNVIAFGTLKPTNDRERVILIFETTAVGGDAKQELGREVWRTVQQGLGLTIDDVVGVEIGVLPKTSSGKLQRSKTRELYESGELLGRTPARKVDVVDTVKELAKSQLGYFRHALSRERDD